MIRDNLNFFTVPDQSIIGGSGDLLLLQIPSIVPILARATVEGRDPLADPATPQVCAVFIIRRLPRLFI